jgi:hypothetical protein
MTDLTLAINAIVDISWDATKDEKIVMGKASPADVPSVDVSEDASMLAATRTKAALKHRAILPVKFLVPPKEEQA